jgi:hypothetical protein
MSDARNREKAVLILLIGDYMSARRSTDGASKTAAIQALRSFSLKTAFPDLATRASSTITVGTMTDTKEALLRMAEMADQLSPLRQTFQTVAEIADTRQVSLFFPRVASTLVQADELLQSLLETVESFQADIAAVRDDFSVDKLKDLTERVKTTAEALGSRVDAI